MITVEVLRGNRLYLETNDWSIIILNVIYLKGKRKVRKLNIISKGMTSVILTNHIRTR